jgi:hypothetical protein
MKRQSSQAEAQQHAEALKHWITTTDLCDIPLNQFGRAARASICKILKIARSSVGSNESIARLFSELDAKLAAGKFDTTTHNLTPSKIRELLAINRTLIEENAKQRAKIERLSYLEDTGFHIPPVQKP